MRRLLILAALCAGTAHAEFRDGNKLLSDMRGTEIDRVFAIGYVLGVADSVRSVTFCPPANVSAGQLNDLVRKYLEGNPAIRHLAGDAIVSVVISDAWPCPRRNNSGGRNS